MTKEISRKIEKDALIVMLPCLILHFFREALELIMPVVVSWMIGDMANALLTLNMEQVKSRFLIFMIAFLLNIFAFPLVRLAENYFLITKGFQYSNNMFEKYLYLPVTIANTLDSATLVNRIDDDTTDYYFILLEKWTRPVTLTGYMIVLCSVFIAEKFHPVFIITLLGLAAVPLLRAFMNGKNKAEITREDKEYVDKRQGLEFGLFEARDFLGGFDILNLYIGRIHEKFSDYCKTTAVKKDGKKAADSVFTYLCNYGVSLGVIVVGAILISKNSMTIGGLLAGYLIIPTLTQFYQYFEGLVLNINREKVDKERLEIFYADHEEATEEVPDLGRIELKDICFSYNPNENPIFEGLNLTINANEKNQLTGKNGSGKSTLLMMLAGIYRPTRGEIFAEKPVDYAKLRNAVSLQEQDGYIFSGTVAENLFIHDSKLSEAEKLLTEMGMEKNLHYQVQEGGENLSPGEKKKILLVRALFKKSKVLALDEPLNHLDAHGAEILTNLLTKESRGLLIISHLPLTISDINIINVEQGMKITK